MRDHLTLVRCLFSRFGRFFSGPFTFERDSCVEYAQMRKLDCLLMHSRFGLCFWPRQKWNSKSPLRGILHMEISKRVFPENAIWRASFVAAIPFSGNVLVNGLLAADQLNLWQSIRVIFTYCARRYTFEPSLMESRNDRLFEGEMPNVPRAPISPHSPFSCHTLT